MQNHIEKESKILEIDKKKVIQKLVDAGAKKILDTTTIIETYDLKTHTFEIQKKQFPSDLKVLPILEKVKSLTLGKYTLLSKNAYLRLRKEGKHLELILKYSEGRKNELVKSEREISITIKDNNEWLFTQKILNKSGLYKIFYQEKKRTSFVYAPLSLRFDIDTWPGVPTYVEIEGKNQKDIEHGAHIIGYETSALSSYKAKDVFHKYSISSTYLSFSEKNVRINKNQIIILMEKSLKKHNLPKKDRDYIIDHYLKAELKEKFSHGIRKFCWDFQHYDQVKGKPFFIKNNKASSFVNCNKEIGPLAMRFCINDVIKKANKYGIGLVGLNNFQRYGILATWTEEIAKKNCIGIFSNSTELFVVKEGGQKPVLGTNPLSISVPSLSNPVVLDMSTIKSAMSNIWYNRSSGKKLKEKTFFDKNGLYTIQPDLAKFASIWGGKKGFNLSFILQILTSTLLNINTQKTGEDPFKVGAIIIAIDPSFFTDLHTFKKEVSKTRSFIRKQGFETPGDHSHKILKKNTESSTITIPENIWGWLNLLYL